MFIFRTISQPRTLSADIPAAGRGLFTKYWQYGRKSAHLERQSRDLLGGSGGMPPLENFENLSTLRCNLVQSGRLNLANGRIPY